MADALNLIKHSKAVLWENEIEILIYFAFILLCSSNIGPRSIASLFCFVSLVGFI